MDSAKVRLIVVSFWLALGLLPFFAFGVNQRVPSGAEMYVEVTGETVIVGKVWKNRITTMPPSYLECLIERL